MLEPGKHQRGCSILSSREHPPPIVSDHTTECIPTLTQPPYVIQAAHITGEVGSHMTVRLPSGHLHKQFQTKTPRELFESSRTESLQLLGHHADYIPTKGTTFECHLLSDLCKAFKVTKSHTTPYHPMGDGLVERINWSLLNLLRAFAQKSSE